MVARIISSGIQALAGAECNYAIRAELCIASARSSVWYPISSACFAGI